MTLQSSVNQVLSVAAILGGRRRTEVERSERIERAKQREEIAAQKALQKEQERKRKTRRVFNTYMQDEMTSYGRFGDLPLSVQKSIEKQYTKSQRQTIMNRKDAERGRTK